MDTVFGIPGTHNLEVYRHLALAGIRAVAVRHEQGAGYAADGYARSSGRPGVCVVTSGPAVLNAAAAIGQAYSDSVPLLVISPGLPLRHPGRGNGFLHEMRDQSGTLGSVAGYSRRVTSVAEVPLAVAEAFASFRSGRPRPVHLEVPVDVLEETAEVVVGRPLPVARLVPEAGVLARVARVLAAAERVAVLVGGGAKAASAQVRELAERLGAPVLATANGKGVLDEEHPLSLGAGVHLGAVGELVRECEVLVVLGSELAPSDFWGGPMPAPRILVRVDLDAGQLRVNAEPDLAVAGDVGEVLGGLLPLLAERGTDIAWVARWRERLRQDARAEGARWLWLLEVLGQELGDGVLGADSAMTCYYGALANLVVRRPGGFLYPTGFGTLGFGLPAAIGAALALPGTRVAALLGDGGVMFTVAELATAAQLGLPLPVLVVDNGGYGEIRAEMAQRGDPVQAVDLPGPDFVALARALGCHGERIAHGDAESLRAALREAFAADRPTVLHLPE
ncbi:acetolactate synthase-1/2/3 large subunit [Crossiella equi]|uniref:Acetolactate synthase-1/2/3 large subunit n=1 Tax=Crossiella equi TaxID=130796 RepID=A0ABS5A472_9PSEU|nr:acetolactate synthase-1/2/3 large subunit [Crossiella equi]